MVTSHEQPKAKIKGAYERVYCCYGNLLSQKNDYNMFSNVWAKYFDTKSLLPTDVEYQYLFVKEKVLESIEALRVINYVDLHYFVFSTDNAYPNDPSANRTTLLW